VGIVLGLSGFKKGVEGKRGSKCLDREPRTKEKVRWQGTCPILKTAFILRKEGGAEIILRCQRLPEDQENVEA